MVRWWVSESVYVGGVEGGSDREMDGECEVGMEEVCP
jgi:hypothetical protein